MPYSYEDDYVDHPYKTGAKVLGLGVAVWIILAIFVAVGSTVGYLYFVHVRSGQIKQEQKFDPTNQIGQNEHFYTLYAAVKTYDQQINVQAAALKDFREAHKGMTDTALGDNAREDSRLASVVTGLKNQCFDASNTYNEDSKKFLRADFKPPDLPLALPDGPRTDCREDAS